MSCFPLDYQSLEGRDCCVVGMGDPAAQQDLIKLHYKYAWKYYNEIPL
jgi:hypothetical protein